MPEAVWRDYDQRAAATPRQTVPGDNFTHRRPCQLAIDVEQFIRQRSISIAVE
jgi:hypothetical protein